MNISIALILLSFYLHLGWCWVGFLSDMSDEPLSRWKWWLVLVVWPLSMIATDAALEDTNDNQH